MGFLELGSEIYFSFFKLVVVFSFFFIIGNSIFHFVDVEEHLNIPQIDFATNMLNSAISTIQGAKGLDFAVAIPALIVGVFGLMIQAFINSILLVRFVINFFVNNILTVLGVPASTSILAGEVVSWIAILPAIIGIIADIGRLIFYMLFGMRK